jgi:hypothetical protein
VEVPFSGYGLAMKRLQLCNISRSKMFDAIKNYTRALPTVFPDFPAPKASGTSWNTT